MDSHEYQKLPLAPLDEFLAKHPEYADADENALMVARIEDERAEREALENQRQELLKRKQKLIAENKKRREDLANLDNDLEKFIDVGPLCSAHGFHYTVADSSNHRLPNRSRRHSKRSFELEEKCDCAYMHMIVNFCAMGRDQKCGTSSRRAAGTHNPLTSCCTILLSRLRCRWTVWAQDQADGRSWRMQAPTDPS